MKAMHAVLTFGVFFPSLATAFSVLAALEIGGRRRGGTGIFGWFRKLPWGDPSVSGQILAMLVFVLGGATGLVNASFTMNQVIHNTAWVPGHFHMTVGTAVALTLMAVAYWLIPYLTGKALFSRRMAVVSNWMYTIGVLIFARGMISGGLAGMPRRTFIAEASYSNPAWVLPGILTGIGGTLMFIAVILFFLTIGLTVAIGRKGEGPADIPVSRTLTPPAPSGWELSLDRLGWWVVAAIILILIAYGPFFVGYEANFVSPGFKLF
jgi:cytochrome c oxidase subunit 1